MAEAGGHWVKKSGGNGPGGTVFVPKGESVKQTAVSSLSPETLARVEAKKQSRARYERSLTDALKGYRPNAEPTRRPLQAPAGTAPIQRPAPPTASFRQVEDRLSAIRGDISRAKKNAKGSRGGVWAARVERLKEERAELQARMREIRKGLKKAG